MEISIQEVHKFKEYMERKKWAWNTQKQYNYYALQWVNKEYNQDALNTKLRRCSNNYPAFAKGFNECFSLDFKIQKRTGRKPPKDISFFTIVEIKMILSH